MCELFAMSGRFPAPVDRCLDELASRGGQTGPHRDGWGIAYYAEDGAVQLFKEAEAASGSDWVSFIQAHPFNMPVVLSHIRRASQGGISLKNTQPFRRELGVHCHVFAHNGDLADIESDQVFTIGFHRPIGETDSEYAFCALLGRLERLWLSTDGVPPLERRFDIVVRFARDLRSLGMANFIYADGDAVFAHGNLRTERPNEPPRPPGLHFLHRVCSGNSEDSRCRGPCPASGSEEQEMALIASVPLTDEAWRPFREGEVLALRAGRIAARAG